MEEMQRVLPGTERTARERGDVRPVSIVGMMLPGSNRWQIRFQPLGKPMIAILPRDRVGVSEAISQSDCVVSSDPPFCVVTMPRWMAENRGMV